MAHPSSSPAAKLCLLDKTAHYSLYLQQLEEIKANMIVRVQLCRAVMGHYMVTGWAAVTQGDGSVCVNQARDGVKPWGYVIMAELCTWNTGEGLWSHTGMKWRLLHCHKYADSLKVLQTPAIARPQRTYWRRVAREEKWTSWNFLSVFSISVFLKRKRNPRESLRSPRGGLTAVSKVFQNPPWFFCAAGLCLQGKDIPTPTARRAAWTLPVCAAFSSSL